MRFLIMMSVELVVARGVTDSASCLSYPYTNELVNSVIKARVYICVGHEDGESFSATGAYGAEESEAAVQRKRGL